jgi:hypothetical protein
VRRNLLDQLDLLDTGRMIDASLQNAASVPVSANGNAVLPNCIKDELNIHQLNNQSRVAGSRYLSVFGFQAIQTLLNDVVAIEILYKLYNFAFKRMHYSLNL